MRRVLLAVLLVLVVASYSWAAKQTVLSGTGVTWGVEVGKINSNFTELYNRYIGNCTGYPCYDGSSDGGTHIRLYGASGYYQGLKAGNSVANREWTLPTDPFPAAGTTRILYVDDAGRIHADLDPDSLSGSTTGLPDGTEANQLIMWDGADWVLTSTLGLIDDTATDGDINKIWSADKIYDQLAIKANTNADTIGYSGSVRSNATTGVLQIVGPAAGATRVMTVPDVNFTVTRSIAAGTTTLNPASISSGTCSGTLSSTATGTLTSDTVAWTFASDPTSVVGYQASANGMVVIILWPTADNVNFKVCNNTAGAIDPGSININWKVTR